MTNTKLFSPCIQEITYIETSLNKRTFLGSDTIPLPTILYLFFGV